MSAMATNIYVENNELKGAETLCWSAEVDDISNPSGSQRSHNKN